MKSRHLRRLTYLLGLTVFSSSTLFANPTIADPLSSNTALEVANNSQNMDRISLAESSDGGWSQHVFSEDDGKLSYVEYGDVPNIVKQLMGDGDRVIKAIKTMGGLHAWIVQPASNPTQSLSYFTTPDDLFVLSGSIFFEDSKKEIVSLSSAITSKYQPINDVAEQWKKLESEASYIQEGSTGDDKQIVYAFFDTNCGYCHLSWLAFKPYVDTSEVQLRWIPAAALSESSALRAAGLLQSDNARTSLVRSYLTWNHKDEGASFESASKIDPDTAKKIESNNSLLKGFGATGMPTFVYKDNEGIVNMVSGAMSLDQIPKVLNVKEIHNSDPRLDKLR